MGLEGRKSGLVTGMVRERIPNVWCNKTKRPLTRRFQGPLRNFKKFLGRRTKSTRALVGAERRREVVRKSFVKVTKSESSHLELPAEFDRKPVELSQKRCDVITLSFAKHKPSSTVLHSL